MFNKHEPGREEIHITMGSDFLNLVQRSLDKGLDLDILGIEIAQIGPVQEIPTNQIDRQVCEFFAS